MDQPVTTEGMEQVERRTSSVTQSAQSFQALVPGFLDKGPEHVEIVGERNTACASGQSQGSWEVAAQDVFAVLGLLANVPVKIEAAATRVTRHCAAHDLQGADEMLEFVAKEAAPDGHRHCGSR